MRERERREGVEREGVTPEEPIPRETPGEGVEREGGEARTEEPLKRHGDALVDGASGRRGVEERLPEERSQ